MGFLSDKLGNASRLGAGREVSFPSPLPCSSWKVDLSLCWGGGNCAAAQAFWHTRPIRKLAHLDVTGTQSVGGEHSAKQSQVPIETHPVA